MNVLSRRRTVLTQFIMALIGFVTGVATAVTGRPSVLLAGIALGAATVALFAGVSVVAEDVRRAYHDRERPA